MTEKFIVSTIIKFTNGDVFFPTPIICSDLDNAKEVARIVLVLDEYDSNIREQVDVYIDSYPRLQRLEHKSWRKGRE